LSQILFLIVADSHELSALLTFEVGVGVDVMLEKILLLLVNDISSILQGAESLS